MALCELRFLYVFYGLESCVFAEKMYYFLHECMFLAENTGLCMHEGWFWKKNMGLCMHEESFLEKNMALCMHKEPVGTGVAVPRTAQGARCVLERARMTHDVSVW